MTTQNDHTECLCYIYRFPASDKAALKQSKYEASPAKAPLVPGFWNTSEDCTISGKLYSSLRDLRRMLVKEAGDGVMAHPIFGLASVIYSLSCILLWIFQFPRHTLKMNWSCVPEILYCSRLAAKFLQPKKNYFGSMAWIGQSFFFEYSHQGISVLTIYSITPGQR